MATNSRLSVLVEGLLISSLLLSFSFFPYCEATSRGIESMDPRRIAPTSDASTDSMVRSCGGRASCQTTIVESEMMDSVAMHRDSDSSVADLRASSRSAEIGGRMRDSESQRMSDIEPLIESDSGMRANEQLSDSNQIRETEQMRDSADWKDSERMRDAERAVRNMERLREMPDSDREMSSRDPGMLRNSKWTSNTGPQMRVFDTVSESESMGGSDRRMRDSDRIHLAESNREWEASQRMRESDRIEETDRMNESDRMRDSDRMGMLDRMRDSDRMGESDSIRGLKRIGESDRMNLDSKRTRDSNRMGGSDRSWGKDRSIDSKGRRDAQRINAKDLEMLRDWEKIRESKRMRNSERRTTDVESFKNSKPETMRELDRMRTSDRRRDLERKRDSGKLWDAAAERTAELEKSKSQITREDSERMRQSPMHGRLSDLERRTQSDSGKTKDFAIMGDPSAKMDADTNRMRDSNNLRDADSGIGDSETERELVSTMEPIASFCQGTGCQSTRDVHGKESRTRGNLEVMHWSSRHSKNAPEMTGSRLRGSERMDTSSIEVSSCILNGADCHISPDRETRGSQPMVTCSDDHCRQTSTRGSQPTVTCSGGHCHQTSATTEESMARTWTSTERIHRSRNDQELVRSEKISSERRAAGSEASDAEMRGSDKPSTAAGKTKPRMDTKDSQSARDVEIDGSGMGDSTREMDTSESLGARSTMKPSLCIGGANCRSNREVRHMSLSPRDSEMMDLDRRGDSRMMHTGSKKMSEESRPRRGVTMDPLWVDSESEEIQSEMMRRESNQMRTSQQQQVMGSDATTKMDSKSMGSQESHV